MEPKALKLLKETWEKKLKKEGLGDIEDAHGNLKVWHSFWFKHPSVGWDLANKAEYYRRAEHFLNSYTFKSKKEKSIWTMYSQAVSRREIAKKLKMNRAKVRYIVSDLIEEMKKWVKLERLSDDEF